MQGLVLCYQYPTSWSRQGAVGSYLYNWCHPERWCSLVVWNINLLERWFSQGYLAQDRVTGSMFSWIMWFWIFILPPGMSLRLHRKMKISNDSYLSLLWSSYDSPSSAISKDKSARTCTLVVEITDREGRHAYYVSQRWLWCHIICDIGLWLHFASHSDFVNNVFHSSKALFCWRFHHRWILWLSSITYRF